MNANKLTLNPDTVALIGVPYDEQSSFLRGAALAPAPIRAQFYSDESHLCAENGIDLRAHPGWQDLGDLSLGTGAKAHEQIADAARALLAQGARGLFLGGDHAISYPLLQAYGETYPNLTVLHLDAHPDLYDELDGNRWSHGCPFARIMEEGRIGRLVQVGIRGLTPHLRQQAERFGVEVIDMIHWQPGALPPMAGPLYLSLDLDALDPAFAPGVSHREPGGLSTREVLALIHRLAPPLVGADLVEYNPVRDVDNLTAKVAAKLTKEILACMLAPTHT
jgi:agmatinase